MANQFLGNGRELANELEERYGNSPSQEVQIALLNAYSDIIDEMLDKGEITEGKKLAEHVIKAYETNAQPGIYRHIANFYFKNITGLVHCKQLDSILEVAIRMEEYIKKVPRSSININGLHIAISYQSEYYQNHGNDAKALNLMKHLIEEYHDELHDYKLLDQTNEQINYLNEKLKNTANSK